MIFEFSFLSFGLTIIFIQASCYVSGDCQIVQTPDIPSLANVKLEPPNADEFQSSNESTVGPMPYSNFVLVKTEVQTAGDEHEDDLDHMLLRERMKLLSSRNAPSLNTDRSPKSVSKMTDSDSGCRLDRSKPAHSLKINRPRKRRKTATYVLQCFRFNINPQMVPKINLVIFLSPLLIAEIPLKLQWKKMPLDSCRWCRQLFTCSHAEFGFHADMFNHGQVLIDKGVTLDEIKLYGEPESNDALDDSSTKDSFGELEEVIAKVGQMICEALFLLIFAICILCKLVIEFLNPVCYNATIISS